MGALLLPVAQTLILVIDYYGAISLGKVPSRGAIVDAAVSGGVVSLVWGTLLGFGAGKTYGL